MLKFYKVKDNSLLAVEGELPKNIMGAQVSLLLLYNDKLVHSTKGKAYVKKGKVYVPSTKYRFLFNKDVLRVFIDGKIGSIPAGKYYWLAYAEHTPYQDALLTTINSENDLPIA